jgi:flavin reductase (DIM6/NTAB) family NADH-FMN oxidoreductase RutF
MENKRKNLSPGTLTAPLPPAMVTVGDYDNANIITIAWTGILASVPPKTYISVRPSRHSHGMLMERGEFVINLPSANLARTVDFVGIYTGAKMDKFEKCSLTKQKSDKVAPPTIAECPIALECRVCEVVSMGSHDVFIADIVGVSCHEDLIDADGKIHYEKADLLAYAHGEYYTLGNTVGRFGFSTDKQKKTVKKEAVKKPTEKTEKKPEEADEGKKEHRPFYLDAPRGKGSRKKPSGRKKAVHK